jgi:hypothetical protein
MSLEELKETLKDNKVEYCSVSTAELVNIYKFVNVNLQMDFQTLDYYYEINVNELLESDFPSSELETLKKQGWAFTEDNKFLVLYLKN